MNDLTHETTVAINRLNHIEDLYKQEQNILTKLQTQLENHKQKAVIAKQASALIQVVAQQLQSKLEKQITTLVNLAINSVFENAPIFKMEIVVRRNKTECDLLFEEQGELSKPIDSSGGGLLDIVSFALRVVIWTFTDNDNVLILDEPFKFLSPNLAEKASDMLSALSEKLGLQIIMVSHAEGINTSANKIFILEKPDDLTIIKEGV